MQQTHSHAAQHQLQDCCISNDGDAISTASTTDLTCHCHVVDGAQRRRRDGVHRASNGCVDGGVEKRALRAVVEGREELAGAVIGHAAQFALGSRILQRTEIYRAIRARAANWKHAGCVVPLICRCSVADIARALHAGSRELLALFC